jgi:hypothetical protein
MDAERINAGMDADVASVSISQINQLHAANKSRKSKRQLQYMHPFPKYLSVRSIIATSRGKGLLGTIFFILGRKLRKWN